MAVRSVAGFSNLIGKYGTVVDIYGHPPIGVEFDESFHGGHDCRGHGKYNMCRYGEIEDFILVEEDEEILISNEDKCQLDSFLSSFNRV